MSDPQTQKDLIEYKFTELFKRLERMEGKMDNFAFVKQIDFEDFKREVREIYATKESVATPVKLIYGLAALMLIAVVGAVVGARLK